MDPAAGGRRLKALVVINLAPGTASDQFAIDAARQPPVTQILHLAGASDYLLRVACRDTAELDVLLRTLRLKLGAAGAQRSSCLRAAQADGTLSRTYPWSGIAGALARTRRFTGGTPCLLRSNAKNVARTAPRRPLSRRRGTVVRTPVSGLELAE